MGWETGERTEIKTMNDKLLIGLFFSGIGFVGGFLCTATIPQDDQLKHYRSVLIRNGIAEYRADENGEPIFVITHKEDGTKPTDR